MPTILAFRHRRKHYGPFRIGPTLLLATLLWTLPALPRQLQAQLNTPLDISQELETIRARQKVPGIVAALVVGDRIVAQGVCGERRSGSGIPLTLDDKLHLGSCTKAMTATMIATLVADEKLTWETAPTEVWRTLHRSIHSDFEDVTMEILLAHRSGLPKDVNWWQLPGKTPRSQRAQLVREVLSKEAEARPGEYLYSNLGYAIAGAMAERMTGKGWRDLMQERLFSPLGMNSAGFGPPSENKATDQPWGHRPSEEGLEAVQIDNAPSLGPAGTVHMSIADWAKFASLHLKAHPQRAAVLTDEAIDAIHQPFPGSKNPAYGFGWITTRRGWGGGDVLTHTGSNTTWHATIWIAPQRNFALLAVTNTGAENAHETCDETILKLLQIWRAGTWR